MRKWLNGIGIGVGALVITTLGISASDSVRGISGSLVSTIFKSEHIVGCASDSVEFTVGEKTLCVDRFEASADAVCPALEPRTIQESESNLATSACKPVSEKDMTPWRFINLSQAQRACAAAGKRLLRNEEWYRAALGTVPDTTACLLSGAQNPRTTIETTCKSTVGAYDMVGNVWEWIDEEVDAGKYNDRALPETGYVTGVDADGVAVSTTKDAPDALYGEDYFWQEKEGVRGMLRGGFYSSEKDGGLYTMNASVDLSFGSAGVGFRCVRDYPH